MMMTVNADDFREPAKQAYDALKAAFAPKGSSPFWRLGHSFDTVVDYLATVDRTDANNFALLALQKYKEGGGDWYDDYPWWGLANLKASQCSDLFGGHEVAFRQYALDCWQTLNNNAPYGWDRADQTTFADYEPLYEGGVWNHVIDAGCNPSPRCANGLCGRQNTVTNALYLGLATRLFLDQVVTTPAYKEAADREYAFLHKWFALDDPKHALLNFYRVGHRDKAVVRERVGRFLKDGVKDAKYRPDLAWAGDQGLVLGALVDRMCTTPSNSVEYKRLRRIAHQLIAGTMDHLVDRDTDKRGILRPWWPNPSPDNDDNDYWTGIAVFMRYVLYAYQNNTDLKKDLQQKGAQDFVRANAEYVVKDPNRPQSTDKVVNLTNNLATLVAAVGVLQS